MPTEAGTIIYPETSAPMVNGKELDDWLNEVDYLDLIDGSYIPSEFSLQFANFIKLVNGHEGETNKTPPVHLKMMDKVVLDISNKRRRIANLCFRGAAKTTLFFEYFSLYLAVYGELPGLGDITGMIYVSDSMENGVKNARKNIEFRYENSPFLKEWVPEAHFTDARIEFKNKAGHPLDIKMFGAKTGIRGTKINGRRPKVCVLDDLVSDEDARSPTAMAAIKATVNKGIKPALDPMNNMIIFNGTPFNKDDVLISAVESGAWDVNVWPVCERWPCDEADFVSAWPDRFDYDFVKQTYEEAVMEGDPSSFMQEYMLRITSAEEMLVQESEIRWYKREELLKYKSNYNFYITTDLALSEKQRADYSVISVWAYNANGDWFWVDGVCARQGITQTYDDLFRLVQEYQPQSVGIEVNAQQMGFVPWLQQQMMERNIWFNFASSENGNRPGIRVVQNKLVRFKSVVPLFKAGHIYFPQEMRASKIMGHFIGQIKLATESGLKGKDDCIDTISMLMSMKAWKPSGPSAMSPDTGSSSPWSKSPSALDNSPLSNYVV